MNNQGSFCVAPSQRTYKQWKAEQADKAAKRAVAKERKAERIMREQAEKNRRDDMDKASKSAIIKASNTKEEIQVHLVGKIDRDIYKCITDDIVTDEVIITDERIQHIKERRGEEFYNIYADKFIEVIQSPDYIFADKSNTALACKEFAEDGKFVNVVLRIVVSSDNPEYKNSIITAVGENRKRFQQRLRNNNPLYKKG